MYVWYWIKVTLGQWPLALRPDRLYALPIKEAEAPICLFHKPLPSAELLPLQIQAAEHPDPPPEVLPSVLALTKFARPAGQLLRPPCREEGYTRLSVGGNKQLLWAAGIKVDPARWNLWLFLFLGLAEQQSPRATIEQPQWLLTGAMGRTGWGLERGRGSQAQRQQPLLCLEKGLFLIRTQQFLFTVVPNIPHTTTHCKICAKAQQPFLFEDFSAG